jgi:serine/threonine-protein kinase
MLQTTTSPTFLQRLKASRLLDAQQIAAATEAAGTEEKALARHLVHSGLLTRFQARQIFSGASGFDVGTYIVLDCLGRGGNGIVFKARHRLIPERVVALKTLDATSLHKGNDAAARFRREIEIVTQLHHPNVVQALDVVSTRNHTYLVLEFVEGCDLATLVRQRGPLPVGEAVSYAVQALRGLGYAHHQGIVHRDLKPSNLLVTRDGQVKLSDLGLARIISRDESDPELTVKGLCLGTPEFMSPEQAEDASKADACSDLYSLGATLFHLLTGELPVTGKSYLHCLQKLLTAPPRPLLESRPDVPAGLAEVVDRLRSRDPVLRPATAEAAIALLEPFVASGAKEPKPWDARSKAALVLEVLQGKATAEQACAREGLAADEFERWRQRFLEGAERALEGSAGPTLQELHAEIGAQALEIKALKQQLAGVTGRGEVA